MTSSRKNQKVYQYFMSCSLFLNNLIPRFLFSYYCIHYLGTKTRVHKLMLKLITRTRHCLGCAGTGH